MNNKRVRTKAMAMAVAAAMAVELCPVTAFAVTGDQVAADGTYEVKLRQSVYPERRKMMRMRISGANIM